MPVVTPSTVRSLQAAILQEVSTLGSAVSLNAAIIDDATRLEWHALQVRALAFTQESPSWLSTAAQVDEGQQIQRELLPWHARLQALGAQGVPMAPPGPPPPESLFGSLSSLGGMAVAVVALLVLRDLKR